MDLWEYAAQEAPQDTVNADIPPQLLRAQERRLKAEERAISICREQQEAVSQSEAARAAILKGIQAGEPAEKLLLIAVECIGTITGDHVFSEQCRADLLTVYGKGLQQPAALEVELEGIQDRLAMLTRAELDAEPEDTRRRIKAAIRAHKRRENEIKAMQAGRT